MDGSSIIIEAPDTNRDVLADYIFEKRKLRPSADGNWSFTPIPGEINVTFRSSSEGDVLLDPNSIIEKIGVDEDGFGKFRIHFDN